MVGTGKGAIAQCRRSHGLNQVLLHIIAIGERTLADCLQCSRQYDGALQAIATHKGTLADVLQSFAEVDGWQVVTIREGKVCYLGHGAWHAINHHSRWDNEGVGRFAMIGHRTCCMAIDWVVIYIILQQLAHLQIQHAPSCMLAIDMSVATWYMDRSGSTFKCIIWYRWRCGSFKVEGCHSLAVEERTTSNGSHGCWKDNLACQFGILCKCFLANSSKTGRHIDAGHRGTLIERILTNLSHRIW